MANGELTGTRVTREQHPSRSAPAECRNAPAKCKSFGLEACAAVHFVGVMHHRPSKRELSELSVGRKRAVFLKMCAVPGKVFRASDLPPKSSKSRRASSCGSASRTPCWKQPLTLPNKSNHPILVGGIPTIISRQLLVTQGEPSTLL